MAGKGIGCLAEAMGALRVAATKPATFSRTFTRTMATEASSSESKKSAPVATPQAILESWNPISTVPLTIHNFPSLEPTSLEQWSVNHLYLPLRRDLLHLAVVYEGDNTRQGTASSKTRYDVHGSHRKMRPQKGTGRARMGTKQSPINRGGGKTFGPQPRDFGTNLNRKVYDKAWRTALSYRYRKGDLIVCEDGMNLPLPTDFELVAGQYLKDGLRETYLKRYMTGVLSNLGLGRASGRTLFVTGDRREALFEAMEQVPQDGRVLDIEDVDVKDLLETGKLVLERSVLKELIEQHQSDLVSKVVMQGLVKGGPAVGTKILGA
ncbi:ribosomal protein L4 domain-containing protein [Ilyonectria robusta]|uniref:ribosomal protein L4 domain-containing protein n=1 Tax=Ilyonectria robusta TaxID=1079257 RepID=UPI001E8CA8A7|nr:ribosomal protein L4 domain-containing protein [Ilyonectria robusta]KAH8734019.1 ribosomal protein L4 domain-containing protein [Ilyonectria robusta]